MSIFIPNFVKVMRADMEKYWKDAYTKGIPVQCDDTCSNECEVDHGYVKLPEDFQELFTKEDKK